MGQRPRKKTYRVRYDRIIFVLAILVVLILILSSCISSCGKKKKPDDSSSVVDNMSSTDSSVTPNANTDSQAASGDSTSDSQPVPQITYANITLDAAEIHRGNLILVNAEHPCTFDTAAIEGGTSTEVQKVTIKSILDTKSAIHYTAADWEVGMDKEAAYAMDAWLEAFYGATGNTDIRMIRGYKSDSEDPDFLSGRTCMIGIYPQTGSSGYYKQEGTYAWAGENAHNYGFVLRYPEGKESYFDSTISKNTTAVFRYVGIAAATYMYQNGQCLEEYLETVKSSSIDNMLTISASNATYGVYYVPANANGSTSFSVPAGNTEYSISGNNMDGFVVTVTLSGTDNIANAVPDVTEAPAEGAAAQ